MPSPIASAVPASAQQPPTAGNAALAPQAIPQPKRWLSQTIFGNEREVEIEHGGQLYRLRQTSLGKLILTK